MTITEMRDFKRAICRVNLQEIRSFLLDGTDFLRWHEKPDTDSYEERLRKGEAPLWKFLESLYPDGEKRDAVCGFICEAIVANQDVYVELGIRLGAKLLFELLQSDPSKEFGNDENGKEG